MAATAEQCLTFLHRGANEMRRNNLETAGRLFSAVVEAAKALPKEQSYAIFPIATANLSLLAIRQGKPEPAAQLRAITLTTLDAIGKPPMHPGFLQLMADALFDLGEHRRAIPFYESCAQLVSDSGDAISTAALLSRTGQCYCRAGMHDQGAVPLRAANRIFRRNPGDPRTPDALLNLGNALRKKLPAEAEAVYKEAAEWYESRLQLEAAAPAWVNLGILCSENNRHQESLGWYRKALEVRERSPRTPPARIAGVHNNIANCYRRLGNFTQAHSHIDRALRILETSAAPDEGAAQLVPSAYHTRALIFGAQGRDLEALTWFVRADDCRQKLPSPSLEDTAIDLTELIAVLTRLGRPQEADAARQRLAAIRAAQQTAPPPELHPGDLSAGSAGAVFVEIDRPTSRSQETGNQIAAFGRRLGEEAKASDTGFFSGSVGIPEAVTLMFYGPDAEVLFCALEATLRSDPLSRTARVTLRQGTHIRELSLGFRPN